MLVQEKLDTLLNTTDKNGKKLIYKPEEGGKLYIDIDDTIKCIGHILLGQNNILYTKFEDERNIFRKTNSWSINYTVLRVVDMVHYETRTHDYLIPKERALEFGEIMHFQDTTELKAYVPLQYWDQYHKGAETLFPERVKWIKRVGSGWYKKLEKTLESPLVKGISEYVRSRRQRGVVVYPASNNVFRAFKCCSFEHTKVIILGQDPYHDGTADGLAFSYLNGSPKPHDKSLNLIFKEVERTVYDGMKLDYDFDLARWADQGVLLINSALTVEKGKPLSHSINDSNPSGIGWERFTKIVLFELMSDPTPKVFMMWGNAAKKVYSDVHEVYQRKTIFSIFPHLLLTARHPAYDLRQKNTFGDVVPNYPDTFSGCDHFRKANEFLKVNKRKEIKW